MSGCRGAFFVAIAGTPRALSPRHFSTGSRVACSRLIWCGTMRATSVNCFATLLSPCAATIFSQPALSCSGARSHHHGGLGGKES